jgi:hypothetical protein
MATTVLQFSFVVAGARDLHHFLMPVTTMGFDVFGPTRHVRASTIDDGGESPYDLLELPGTYGLRCPQIERLHQRFYASTTVSFANGEVLALRDEVVRLTQEYRERREPELIRERHVQAKDPDVRREILERCLKLDTVYAVLQEFQLLCEEAIAAKADVQCNGD